MDALRALPEVDMEPDAARRLRTRLSTRLDRERTKRRARHVSFIRATVLATTCMLYLAWAIVFTR
jgi:hypothetical protein